MNEIRTFDEIQAGDVGHVGGKGLSLGLMARAGLPGRGQGADFAKD